VRLALWQIRADLRSSCVRICPKLGAPCVGLFAPRRRSRSRARTRGRVGSDHSYHCVMSEQRVPEPLKTSRKGPPPLTPMAQEMALVPPRTGSEIKQSQDNGQDFSETQHVSVSISKIARKELLGSDKVVLFVENFDAASVHPTVPFGVADCRGLTLVPERAVREAFTLKIPSVMRFAWADFVLIHAASAASLADEILQHQEGFPILSVRRS
jgi:hypothetical protein